MKKLLFILIFLTISLGYSQNNPIDFESGGFGAEWTWTVFENDTDPALEIIPNPVPSGINTSSTVAKFTALQTGARFAGVESMHGADIGTWVVTTDNSTVKMMVYQVGFASPVGLKFATSTGGALMEVVQPNTVSDQWVELTFDMSAWIGHPEGNPDQIIIFPNYEDRTDNNIIYIDNIVFGAQPAPTCDDGIKNGDETGIDCGGSCGTECPPPPAPSVSAQAPTPAVEDVLYIYSDTYTNTAYKVTLNNPDSWAVVPPSNYNFPSTDYSIIGVTPTDNVRLFEDLNNAFIQFATTDATEMKYFYMDVWSANATFFRVNIQDLTAATEGSELFPITANEWNRIEIDLDTYGGLAGDRDELFQLIIFGEPVGIADVYIDNVFFSKEQNVLGIGDLEFGDVKVYPNPSNNVWNFVSSKESISSISIFNLHGMKVKSVEPNGFQAKIDISNLSSGVYFAKMASSENKNKTIKLIKE